MTVRTAPFILAVSLSLSVSSSVLAQAPAQVLDQEQPGAATSEPPPTKDGRVSQINGQLVKVGEHNEYYYDFKRFNVAANPLGAIAGIYGVSASYGVTSNVALHADINVYSNIFDSDASGYEIGIGAPLYLRRTYQGPFVEPGIILRKFGTGDIRGETLGPQVLLGWHSSWDSGFNVSYAFGLGRDFMTGSDSEYHDSESGDKKDTELFANGYFRIGYAF